MSNYTDKESGLVSICIPTFNSERFLSETLGSVFRQTYHKIEIIASDGGSTDSTLDILSCCVDERLRIVTSQGRISPWENWTKSINSARGKYIMLLCHDDILFPDAIECLIDAHNRYPSSVAVAGTRTLIREDGLPLRIQRQQREEVQLWSHQGLLQEVLRTGTNPIGEGLCVLWKSSCGVGNFSSQWNYYIDLDFWIRLTKIGNIAQIQKVVGAFRVNQFSWTSKLGLQVTREAWHFFNFLRHSESATVTQQLRGYVRAAIQAITRSVLQNLINRKIGLFLTVADPGQ